MTCALCRRDEPLLNSHIVPEFLYRPHYDDKHRAMLFDGSSAPFKVLQKGLREPLLCQECEGRLGVFESYFARFWYKRSALPPVVNDPEVVLTGIDYSRFKLFILSIAWRASVSSQASSLGPHEAQMRAMLMNADPGPMHQYPIFAGVIVDTDTNQPWDGVMLAPLKIRVKSHWARRMVFGGAAWTVLTSRHQTLPLEGHFLSERGELILPVLPLREFAIGSGLTHAVRASTGGKPR